MTSGDGQAEMLIRPASVTRGLVLFMHGLGAGGQQIDEPGFAKFRDALIAEGYAIAASNSHGNNAGNPVSVEDQVNLLHDAERRLPPLSDVDILAFSMGGLDALLSASGHIIPHLKAVALISPACNQVPFLKTHFAGIVKDAFAGVGGGSLTSSMLANDPMVRPGSSYGGYSYRFWQSPTDTVVPASQATEMVALLAKQHISAQDTWLVGGHGDFSALAPASVVKFFNGAARA
jgi:hypothetical protein